MKNYKILLSACLIGIIGMAVFAQDEKPLRVETNLVSINVAVTDEKGNFVENLTKDQFDIFDNKIKQQIKYFKAKDTPVSFGIVYDLHPTTNERTTAVLESLRQFTKFVTSTSI